MIDLRDKAWHIDYLISVEPDAQVVILEEAQDVVDKLEAEIKELKWILEGLQK